MAVTPYTGRRPGGKKVVKARVRGANSSVPGAGPRAAKNGVPDGNGAGEGPVFAPLASPVKL